MSSSPLTTPGSSERITDRSVPARWTSVLPDAASVRQGRLALHGTPLAALARDFGTPLYIYDEDTIRSSARRVKRAFPDFRVSFAAKACSTPGILRVVWEEGLDLDVVSLGELTAALRGGFSPSQVHLHGNAKSEAELSAAVELSVHAVVADNLEELVGLNAAAEARNTTVKVMVRAALPLEAETHPHLQTAGRQTKFGIAPASRHWSDAVSLLRDSTRLEFVGVHAHLGSQIADAAIYQRATRELLTLAEQLDATGLVSREVSLGGGWAVPYRAGEAELGPEGVAAAIREETSSAGRRLAVEPGRSIVARAGVAVYQVRGVKEVGERRIVAVDGGMGDNPRTALYGSRYTALPCEDPFEQGVGRADVVGRYCESGDVLVRDVNLPSVRKGDLICVPVSGAYQLVMASAYNLVPQPAVVMVGENGARLLTRRATVDDLLAREVLD